MLPSSFVQNLEIDDAGSSELASILNIVSKEAFEKSHAETHTETKFEKAESFFDLVRSEEITSFEQNTEQKPLEDNISLDDFGTSGSELELAESNNSEFNNKIRTEAQESASLDQVDDSGKTSSGTSVGLEVSDVENSVGDRSVGASAERESQNSIAELDKKIEASYAQGFAEAQKKFETTENEEQKKLNELTDTVFKIQDDLTITMERYLVEKVKELAVSFLGLQIDTCPADFEKHIRNTARNIGNFAKNLKIELCPADFDLLVERQCLSEEQFTFVKNDVFDRGEFEIRADRSSYKQSILEH